ncbi:hypothetical protein OF83DRAFT_1180737 [Amylostereum chailletii]|nr:hypothetical protein OF83DRAFT_1180737 [Amylostereum chailletii]
MCCGVPNGWTLRSVVAFQNPRQHPFLPRQHLFLLFQRSRRRPPSERSHEFWDTPSVGKWYMFLSAALTTMPWHWRAARFCL